VNASFSFLRAGRCIQLLSALAALQVATLATAQTVTREGAWEKMALVTTSDLAKWSAVESRVEPSPQHTKVPGFSWHWHVDVDYTTGEAKYPVGWPRISRTFQEAGFRDWAAWDFLRCWIYVETSRSALPLEPIALGLHTPDRTNAYNRTLSELKKDQWVEIRLPISQIARAQDVRQIQFHVAESNYKHGDRVDFYLNDLALVRYAEPALFNLVAENSVLFSDAAHLPVRFELLGVKPSTQAHVICELRRDGRMVARASVELSRGLQRVALDLTGRKLSPGTYDVHAMVNDRVQDTHAAVRVVESPWK
jgi:hypothetical protein